MMILRSALRAGRTSWLLRGLLWTVVFSLAWLQVSPAYAAGYAVARENARRTAWVRAHTPHVHLPAGLTQTPDAALRARIAAREAAQASKPIADVCPLSLKQMQQFTGRGTDLHPFRNPSFNGTLPWQRSFRDVNLCNGNLFKSFTDIQIAPGRGAGLVLQRTYNSNDARIGPFGIGWTHAYDIRMQEAADVQAESGNHHTDGSTDDVPRTDFFGAKHTYHRDADGLYSPPSYMFDETSSDYDTVLMNGPTKVMADTEKGEDGTIKHYVNVVTLADGSEGNERACDYIQDRHGNTTNLTYGLSYVQPNGSTRKLLTQVTDPSGRSLAFTWTNLGTTAQPAYRITQVQGPLVAGASVPGVTYRVVYGYYTDPNEANAANDLYNLRSVTLDPDGLSRTTTYTYTSYQHTYTDQNGVSQTGTETGLLNSVSDPLGHTVSYTYDIPGFNESYPSAPAFFLSVIQIIEPGGVDASNTPRTVTWCISPGTYTLWYPLGFSNTDCYSMYHLQDSQLRSIGYYKGGDPGSIEATGITAYDNANNVTQKNNDHQATYGTLEFDQGMGYTDFYTYGAHGNVILHSRGGTGSGTLGPNSFYPNYALPGAETTTYYNASQYFQKAGVTDMNGRTTALGVGTSTDANTGNRGETLWVQDAGYSDPNSPSYHKQFTYTYNQYGQKTSEINLKGVVTAYTYGDQWGNLTQVVQDPGAGHLNRTTTMVYDAAGRVLQSTDPLGQTSTFTYNALGQPLTVATPAKGAAPAETITYVYDGNGRTHSVTDNRGTTTMLYETGSDRVHSVQDPVTGMTTYSYLLTGERTAMTLPGGGTWTYAYHTPDEGQKIDNMVSFPKDDPNCLSLSLKSITDDQGRRVETRFDVKGNLLAIRSDETFNSSNTALVSYCQTQYFMDQIPQVGRISHLWLGQIRTTWCWLDAATSQWRQRLISQNDYTYDTAGQRLTNTVTTATTGAGGTPQYNGAPQYSTSVSDPYVPNYGNGTFDAFGSTYAVATNQLTTSRTEKYQKPDGTSGYDALNRLTNVDYGDGQTQSYSFDAMGNRLSRQDSVSGTTNYSYNAANMLLSTGGYGASGFNNDADGNTLSGNGRTNAWDSQNRLVSCIIGGNTTAYKYGADGLRRQSTKNGASTDYAYDATMLVREGHAAGGSLTPATVTATYFIGARGPEYRRDDTQTEVDSQGRTVTKARWYVYDGLGSVIGELDPLGNLTSSPKYDVYGAVRANGGTASSKQGFVGSLGHVSDDTGLIYMRARYYDPAVGRFISEDPAGDGLNWFTYCNNNPTNETDATGKAPLGFADINAFLKYLETANGLPEDLRMNCANWLESQGEKMVAQSIKDAAAAESAETAAAMAEGKALALEEGPLKEYYKAQAAFWQMAAKSEAAASITHSEEGVLLRTVAELLRTDP